MRTLAFAFLRFLAAASALGATRAVADDRSNLPDNSVTVQSAAIVKVAPDRLEIYLQVRAVRPSVKQSQSDVNASTRRLVTALQALEIPESALAVHALEQGRENEWENGRSVFKGYYASTGIRLNLTETAKLAKVQTEILADDLVEVVGINRISDREGELRRKALGDAAEAARQKAEVLATKLGAKLGPVLTIAEASYESSSQHYGNRMSNFASNAVQASSEESPSVGAQEVVIRAQLTVTFTLTR